METKNFYGKLIIALIMAGMIFAGTASADHTTNVTLDTIFVKGGATATYTFNVSNNGASDVFYIRIPIPEGFSYNSGSALCPSTWDSIYSDSTRTVICQCALVLGNNLTAGASGIVSFSATAPTPGVDTQYPWNVTTLEFGGVAGVNASINDSTNTTVDVTGPASAAVDVTGVTAVTGWLNGTVTITCTGATDDSGSGVNASGYNYMYTLDSENWTAISGCTTDSCSWNTTAVTAYEPGVSVRCNATDNVSNTGIWSTLAYAGIDNTAPVTNITVGTPQHINGSGVYFVNSSTLFTITSTDNASGNNSTQYKIDDGSWTDYSTPFSEATTGAHIIYYNSTDNANNTAATKNISIYVDNAAPVVGAILITPGFTNATGTNYTSGTSNITATINDVSGVMGCNYTIDGSTWVAANYTAINSTDGICAANGINTSAASSINIQATDNLTQVGTGTGVPVSPDTTAPEVSVAGVSTWQNTNATAILVCTDVDGSGCNASSYGYNFSDSDPTNCPTSRSAYTFDLGESVNISSHLWVCVYTEDNVTNANVSIPAEFKVDELAPTITDGYASNGTWVKPNQTVTLTPADTGGSGTYNVTYCTNSSGTECTPTTLLSSPYQLDFNGTQNTTVKYQTWDNATSNSSIGSFVVLIDQAAPVANVSGASGDWQNTDATATANCSDSTGSGCNVSSYRLYISTELITSCPTGVDSYNETSPQTISQHSWVCSYVEDNVSNANFSDAVTEFKVDKILPTCSVTSITDLSGAEYVSGTTVYYNPSGSINGTFKVFVDSTDSGGSGINNVTFPVTVSGEESVSSLPYAKSYDWDASDSANYIGATVTCYDNASNTNTSTFSVIKDTTAPTISSVTLNVSVAKQNASINVSSDGADAESGIANCHAYLSTDPTYDEGVDVDLSDLGTDCNGSVTISNTTEGGDYYIIVRPVDNLGYANTSASSVLAIDNTAPTVALTYSANPAKAGTVTITAAYSENVTSVPLISINQVGSTDISGVAMTNTTSDNTTWAYNYTVVAHDGSDYIDGVANVSLSSVSDAAYNAASAPTSASFTIDTTAPTVALTYSADPAKEGTVTITATYSENVTSVPLISINQVGSTDISGVAMTNTTSDNKTWEYNYTVVAHDGSAYIDGVANVSLSSVNDSAGNAAEDPTGDNFTIDTTAPENYSVDVTGVTHTTGWLGKTVNITCNGATDASGVNTSGYNYSYSLDGSDWTTLSACSTSSCSWDTSELSDTISWVRCRASDNVSNAGVWRNKSYAGIDNTAPVTNVSVGSPKYNGSTLYVTSATEFTLNATDAASGVNQTQYWFDTDLEMRINYTNYSGAFNASSAGEGNATLYYRSIDNVSNDESINSLQIFVDDTKPTGSIIISNEQPYTPSVSVSLALTYADAGAGVNQTRYSNDNLTWSDWEAASATKDWTLTSGDGVKTVYYEVQDKLGNVAQFTDTITLYTPIATTTLAPTTTIITTTTSTIASSTTSSSSATTTTTLANGTCVMPGNSAPCNVVTLSEVVSAINEWSAGNLTLANVIDLINSWADVATYPAD